MKKENINFKRLMTILIAATMCLTALAIVPTVSATTINVPADHSTIQEAIDVASAGDTINVADGLYTITTAINVNKGVTITGNIANPENVLVKYSPASSTLNCVEVNSPDVTIQGIKVQDCKNGFHFNRNVNTNTGVTISNCIIESVSGWGIGEISSPNTIISHNTITDAGDKGIYFRLCEGTSESNRCEAISNVISGCGGPAIQTYGSKYAYIYDNTISSTNDKGISILQYSATGATERIQVVGNTISGCGYPAIQTYGGKYTYIYDNTISSTNDKGINIVQSGATGATERIQVISNTISETKWPGIQVIGALYTYVYDNTLTKCNYHGVDGTGDWDYASIHVQDDGAISGDHVIIDNNKVSDGINGIQTWSNDVTITNNEIYDMGLTYESTKTTTDGTYYNSAILYGDMYNVNMPTSATISNNNIHDNYWGLFVIGAYTGIVTAKYNYWGTEYGPQDDTDTTECLAPSETGGSWLCGDKNAAPVGSLGDKVSDNVDYCPWSVIWHVDGALGTDDGTHGYGTGTAAFKTIQYAINDARVCNGDTIIVAAGTYTNDIWDGSSYRITKSITFLGAQAGVDPAGSTDRGGETILVRTNGLPYSLYASGITIDGFMFGSSDPNTGGRLIISPVADNAIIRNCIIQNTPSASSGHGVYIYSGAENALVEYNTFYNTAWEAIASWQVSGAVISYNYISSSGEHAIQMMGHAGSDNEITYNHISGITGKNAIQYWGGPRATISYNVILGGGTMYDGIWLDKDADDSTVSNNQISNTIYAGINIREDCNYAVITYNDISGCGTGVDVVATPVPVTGTVINFNEIYGNGMGVTNYYSTDIVNAEYNWWGDVSGPYDPLDTDGLGQYNPGGLGDHVTEYVLYEPWLGQGGFVTGGGWIDSPAGAYREDPDLTGKANFGFVSKYKKGQQQPAGNTEFNFKVADLNFHSDSYDWLVITGGNKAMYKGTGTINNLGSYKFMITAYDDTPDTFRIKIWEEDDNGDETIIYDNDPGTSLGGGRIKIHQK